MEKSEICAKIKQFAECYLTSKGIDYAAKCERDNCSITVVEKYGLFYVESNSSFYQGTLKPGDKGYPAQAEGMPCPSYKSAPSYRFVCDSEGKIIVDLEEIANFCRINSQSRYIFLDEQNMLIPKLSNRETVFGKCNDIQHFRVKDGEAKLMYTFDKGIQIYTKILEEEKVMTVEGQLYDWEQGVFLGCKFDDIFVLSDNNSWLLEGLAKNWATNIAEEADTRWRQIIRMLAQKMQDEKLLSGLTIIKAEKDKVKCEFCTLVFLDRRGNLASNLFYMDGFDFKSTPVSPETLPLTLQDLREKANQSVEDELARRQIRTGIVPQIKEKLFVTNKNGENI